MKGRFLLIITMVFISFCAAAQQIIFSEPLTEDSKDMNFDVIGKMKNNIIILKNNRSKYAAYVYNDSMELKEKEALDFFPAKVINVDYVAYPDFFYLIYQYEKKSIVYCMSVKMGADGKKINEPVELDTTHISGLGENKIYSTIYSEDKKKIMVFKIQKREDNFHFATILFDNQLQKLHKTRQNLIYDENKSMFSDFMLDNEGNFVFSAATKKTSRENFSSLLLITKTMEGDDFLKRKLNLNDAYIDEVKIKIDNINKRYILNTFYYKERNSQIDGIFCSIWDAKGDTAFGNVFSHFEDDLRTMAKSSGNIKNAFNDFFIRNIILKKDGSFILHAEDFSSQSTGNNNNNWNRNDYLFGTPYYYNPYDYYNRYNYMYDNFYRPYGYGNNQSQRFYYNNILVLSVSKKGMPEWTNIISKQQNSDDKDNHLSYISFITGGEIHFLFNDVTRREKTLLDNVLLNDGSTKRNPSLRTYDKGYEFMPRFAKQIGARQAIIPCTLRSQLCFAKVDF